MPRDLPAVLLQDAFAYLRVPEVARCRTVCARWNQAVEQPHTALWRVLEWNMVLAPFLPAFFAQRLQNLCERAETVSADAPPLPRLKQLKWRSTIEEEHVSELFLKSLASRFPKLETLHLGELLVDNLAVMGKVLQRLPCLKSLSFKVEMSAYSESYESTLVRARESVPLLLPSCLRSLSLEISKDYGDNFMQVLTDPTYHANAEKVERLFRNAFLDVLLRCVARDLSELRELDLHLAVVDPSAFAHCWSLCLKPVPAFARTLHRLRLDLSWSPAPWTHQALEAFEQACLSLEALQELQYGSLDRAGGRRFGCKPNDALVQALQRALFPRLRKLTLDWGCDWEAVSLEPALWSQYRLEHLCICLLNTADTHCQVQYLERLKVLEIKQDWHGENASWSQHRLIRHLEFLAPASTLVLHGASFKFDVRQCVRRFKEGRPDKKRQRVELRECSQLLQLNEDC